jgi:hypothetical protein
MDHLVADRRHAVTTRREFITLVAGAALAPLIPPAIVAAKRPVRSLGGPFLHYVKNGSWAGISKWSKGADIVHPTIAYAIASAHPGDTIKVLGGTYHENIVVPPDKDGLTIMGTKGATVVITRPVRCHSLTYFKTIDLKYGPNSDHSDNEVPHTISDLTVQWDERTHGVYTSFTASPTG